MKGKAKIVKHSDGLYYVYVRNYWFQRWKPLNYDFSDKQISFKTFEEFCKITKIECFDKIIIKYDKFSGFKEE